MIPMNETAMPSCLSSDCPLLSPCRTFTALAMSDELRLDHHMLPGDVAVLSNLTMLHAKTEFKDHGDPDKVGPLRFLHPDLSMWVISRGFPGDFHEWVTYPRVLPLFLCHVGPHSPCWGTINTSCASGLHPQRRPPPPCPAPLL